MKTGRWFEFEVPAAFGPRFVVRLGDFGERWLAEVRCGSTATTRGLGASARESLLAALAPFGSRVTARLMAEPAMFAASAELRTARAAI